MGALWVGWLVGHQDEADLPLTTFKSPSNFLLSSMMMWKSISNQTYKSEEAAVLSCAWEPQILTPVPVPLRVCLLPPA